MSCFAKVSLRTTLYDHYNRKEDKSIQCMHVLVELITQMIVTIIIDKIIINSSFVTD
jgi:hypothetical protein